MSRQEAIDKGVLFALENIEIAFAAASSNSKFNYLCRIISREKYRLKDITRTGDLIRYYEGFADGNHYHAKEFMALASETTHSFIPSETMASELKKRFPDEANHCTEIDDFVPGEAYSNGFLSTVLGGSYALSFRLTRNSDYSYIVMNSLTMGPGTNEWEDGYKTLLFTPPGRFYGYDGGARRLFERHRDRTVLVFDKINNEGFTFFGFYRFTDCKGWKVILKRDDYDGRNLDFRPFVEDNSQIAGLLNDNGVFPTVVIADILTQRAIENGINFHIKKSNDLSFDVDFPYGFFELIGDYEPFHILISTQYNNYLRIKRRSSHVYERQDVSSIGGLVWAKFEEDIKDYKKLYYDDFIDASESITLVNPGLTLKKSRKGKRFFNFKRFLISSIDMDLTGLATGEGTIVNPRESRDDLSELLGGPGIGFDIVIEGGYPRIDVDSPIIVIRDFLDATVLSNDAMKVPVNLLDRLVFVCLNRDKTSYEKIGDHSFLVLGMAFVSQLARLYPSIFAQFLIPEDDTKSRDYSPNTKPISREPLMGAGKNYSDALDLNTKLFQNLVKGGKKIAIITGNGVSIPFGSESWADLANNLLSQLKPRFIESCVEVSTFFGNLSFITTEFAYDTLRMRKEESLYWRTLNYSIYRRFSELIYLENTAIRSISKIKKTFWEKVNLFTYNYDTFLEGQFEKDYSDEKLSSVTVPTGDLGEVVHLHGIFKKDDKQGDDVILTRSKYFEIYDDYRKNAALKLLVNSLEKDVCLFVGSSMTDMFQMMTIETACKSSNSQQLIFALLPIDKLGEGAKECIYQYFLNRHILIIPFKDYKELPNTLLTLFDLEKWPDN